MKYKESITIFKAFQKIKEILVANWTRYDYITTAKFIINKKHLGHNKMIYSTHNEGKSVVAERFNRTLQNNIYKYMTSITKNVYRVYR